MYQTNHHDSKNVWIVAVYEAHEERYELDLLWDAPSRSLSLSLFRLDIGYIEYIEYMIGY